MSCAIKDNCNPVDWQTVRQMILVVTDNWDQTQARLFRCARTGENWQVLNSYPAVCGENGMAWGIGLYPATLSELLQPFKKEGDGKSPAGIFRFGKCMGYEPLLAVNSKWPYQPLSVTMQGVDDPQSRYYNQIIDTAQLLPGTAIDWQSHETMRRSDDLYKWLLVIEHNHLNLPGYGSLIFMHIWENQTKGTAGCTALAESSLLEILEWLDLDHNPVLVQLPREIYDQKLPEWGLPAINTW